MPFLLLLILMAASMPIQWPAPWFDLDPRQSIALTGGALLLFLALCWVASRRTVRAVRRPGCDVERIGDAYGRARSVLSLASLGLFGASLLIFGWGWAVADYMTVRVDQGAWIDLPTVAEIIAPPEREFAGTWRLLPGVELLNLLPFLTLMVGSWLIFYDAERAFHDAVQSPGDEPFWSRLGYVYYRGRQFLVLVFVPVLMLIGQQGFLRLYPDLGDTLGVRLASMSMIPVLLILLPLALPRLLGWTALPPGPTRERLVDNARRLGFRYREIYLWNTRKAMANAMVVGVIPQARYVVMTDRLLHDLHEDEIDAVFGHEVGHARHGHLVYYAVFLMLSVLTIGAVYEVVRTLPSLRELKTHNWSLVAPVVFMGVYMFFIFGFLSRRCERQADLFGCRAVSCGDPHCTHHDAGTPLAPRGDGLCRTGIDAFIRALLRVESVNGMASGGPTASRGVLARVAQSFRSLVVWLQTWQHSTIEKRVAFLYRVQGDRDVERRFQRRVFLLRVLILSALLVTLGCLGYVWGFEVLLGAL